MKFKVIVNNVNLQSLTTILPITLDNYQDLLKNNDNIH